MSQRKRIIAVIGGAQPSSQEARLAEEVGRELARRGIPLVCGGLGGVMEAACRGAWNEGGLTIGILPGDKREAANDFVQIPIVTGLGYARNIAVVKTAQAVIAVGGSYGTLSEISHALQSSIPVVGLNTWSLKRHEQTDQSIIVTHSATEAVDRVMNLTAVSSLPDQAAELPSRPDIRNRLISAARAGEVVFYRELGLGRGPSVGRILEEISHYELNQGRPLLTTVVVGKEKGMPGSGFWKLPMTPDLNERQRSVFWAQEVTRVINYWRSH
jgi:uncharacterized protein (TIGR00725 family)